MAKLVDEYPYRIGQDLRVTETIMYEQGPILRQPYLLEKGTIVQFDGMREPYIAVTMSQSVSNMFVFLVPPDKLEEIPPEPNE